MLFTQSRRFTRMGQSGEPDLLKSCYRRIFELAHDNGLKSIAFPSVGTGFFKYPIEEASKIALASTLEQLKRFPDIQKVVFVLFRGVGPGDLSDESGSPLIYGIYGTAGTAHQSAGTFDCQ